MILGRMGRMHLPPKTTWKFRRLGMLRADGADVLPMLTLFPLYSLTLFFYVLSAPSAPSYLTSSNHWTLMGQMTRFSSAPHLPHLPPCLGGRLPCTV